MKIAPRKGLWVTFSFTKAFGNENIKPAETAPSYKVLPRDMYDHEIRRELGAEVCTLEDLAAFLEKPPSGCDDGFANIFYVAGLVVHVSGSDDEDNPKWHITTWELDDHGWIAGVRVFSRNFISGTQTT